MVRSLWSSLHLFCLSQREHHEVTVFFVCQDVEADHSGYVSDVGFRVSPLFLLFSECCEMVREGCSKQLQMVITIIVLWGVVVINQQLSADALWCLQPVTV